MSGTDKLEAPPAKWTPVQKLLLGVNIAMGAVLVFGMLFMVWALIAGKVGTRPDASAGRDRLDPIMLPLGAEVVETVAGDGHIILRIRDPVGEALLVRDLDTGDVARIPIVVGDP